MAGRGPAPKDPSQRRNRHPPQRGEWVDLGPLARPVLPEAEGDWPEHVVDLWVAWREDPVTGEYSKADLAAVLELARVWDELKASEQRLRMDGLGLTPKGKRDLRWRVVGAAEVVELPARRGRQRKLRAV